MEYRYYVQYANSGFNHWAIIEDAVNNIDGLFKAWKAFPDAKKIGYPPAQE